MAVSSERNFNLQDIYCKESTAKWQSERQLLLLLEVVTTVVVIKLTFCLFVLFLCIIYLLGGRRGHCAYRGKKIEKNTEGCEGSAEVWYRVMAENSLEGNAQQLVAFSGLSVSIALFYAWELKQLCPLGT